MPSNIPHVWPPHEASPATTNAPSSETIKESIKQYLLQFDGYAKAIQEIKHACKDIDALKDVPERVIKDNEKKLDLIKEINVDEFEIKALLNDEMQGGKQEKKLEKLMKKLHDHEMELIKLSDAIHQEERDAERVQGCNRSSGEMLDDIQHNYKSLFEKLSHARKVFPGIYAEAEKESGIFLFTPFST